MNSMLIERTMISILPILFVLLQTCSSMWSAGCGSSSSRSEVPIALQQFTADLREISQLDKKLKNDFFTEISSYQQFKQIIANNDRPAIAYFRGKKPDEGVISKLKKIIKKKLGAMILLLVKQTHYNLYREYGARMETDEDTIIIFQKNEQIMTRSATNFQDEKELKSLVNTYIFGFYAKTERAFEEFLSKYPYVIAFFDREKEHLDLAKKIKNIAMEKDGNVVFMLLDLTEDVRADFENRWNVTEYPTIAAYICSNEIERVVVQTQEPEIEYIRNMVEKLLEIQS